MTEYTICRRPGIVGGYLALTASQYFVPQLQAALDQLLQDAAHHVGHFGEVAIMFKTPDKMGLMCPLDEMRTIGWKCFKCTNSKENENV